MRGVKLITSSGEVKTLPTIGRSKILQFLLQEAGPGDNIYFSTGKYGPGARYIKSRVSIKLRRCGYGRLARESSRLANIIHGKNLEMYEEDEDG
jgi:hypothetical protein